jgi:deoxycytidylate deaminase
MQNNYPYLPEGRTIKYVPITDPFMVEAERARSEISTEMNYPTGAVVVLGLQIIGRAGNQAALKNKKLQEFHRTRLCLRKVFKIPSGQKYWVCPGCAKHQHHAEWGSVRDAVKNKGDITGADLYLYGHWWCCKPCWKSMIDAGIRDVYLVEGAFELFEKRPHVVAEAVKNIQK